MARTIIAARQSTQITVSRKSANRKQRLPEVAAEPKKAKPITAEVQPTFKQVSDQFRQKGQQRSLRSDKKQTPLKKNDAKSKAESKKIAATSSTAKMTGSSKQKEKSEVKDQQPQNQQIAQVATKLFPDKSKPIKKQSKNMQKTQQYQNFYKFHFTKLREEHPNWTADKVTQIISLLWKKAKLQRKHASQQEVKELYEKILSGKEAFKQSKMNDGAKEQQIEQLWSRLPVQSKRKWQLQGSGLAIEKVGKKSKKMNLTKSEQPNELNQYSFLKKAIP